MYIWGITKKYKSLSWFENFMGSHLCIGPITVYGANAMCWAVNIKTKKGYFCFTLPVPARIRINRDGYKWLDWYVYLSPNATPWACTWYIGWDKNERIRAKIRELNFGHGFSTGKEKERLRAINDKCSSFYFVD